MPEIVSGTAPVPTKALVVVLEDGLPAYRVNGLFAAIRQHPGIRCIADLSSIGQDTLNMLLMPPTPLPQPKRRRGKREAG